MSKLTDSLLSGSRGRIGRLVVANVYGTEILKSRPRKRTGNPTAKQVLVQNRMKQCGDFISGYRNFAKMYYGKRQGLKSCFNLAMTNLMNSHVLQYGTMTIVPNYPAIEFARGELLGVTPIGLSSPAAATLKADWADNSAGDALRATDQIQLLYLSEGEAKTVLIQNVAPRSAATCTVTLPAYLSGKTLHVWLTFLSADGLTVSTSSYLGSQVITS